MKYRPVPPATALQLSPQKREQSDHPLHSSTFANLGPGSHGSFEEIAQNKSKSWSDKTGEMAALLGCQHFLTVKMPRRQFSSAQGRGSYEVT